MNQFWALICAGGVMFSLSEFPYQASGAPGQSQRYAAPSLEQCRAIRAAVVWQLGLADETYLYPSTLGLQLPPAGVWKANEDWFINEDGQRSWRWFRSLDACYEPLVDHDISVHYYTDQTPQKIYWMRSVLHEASEQMVVSCLFFSEPIVFRGTRRVSLRMVDSCDQGRTRNEREMVLERGDQGWSVTSRIKVFDLF
jgi:hypothetical protein